MNISTQFAPSSWRLDKMVEAAIAKADASLEQARLAEQARIEARAAKYIEAQARAAQHARTVAFWQGE